jgi:hypothetical protein
MGVVYEARDERLARKVALKVMRADLAAHADARERFLREARAAAALDHENVVPVYQVGECAGPAGRPQPFLVMPLLAGETLAARLARGPLELGELLRLARGAAAGLAAAHAAGLVHRDVKPENLWLEPGGGRVKVLDFGLARAGDDGSAHLTRPGAVLGTPAYMAPEQANGADVDARADLFSLGSSLYHAATGRPPFTGRTLTAVLHAVAEQEPPPAHTLRPDLPRPLSDLIASLMRKRPEDRPPSAAVVAETALALGACATPARARHRGRWAVVAVAAVAFVAAVALLWPKRQPPPTPAPPDPGPPLTRLISGLSVEHFAVRGEVAVPRGEIGPRSVATRFGDQVRVAVKFAEPAYAYLLAFNPDGVEQPCLPRDPAATPDRLDRLAYPADGRAFNLDDATGMQVFAVVASRHPLTAYSRWKDARPDLGWLRLPAEPGSVWRGDGDRLEPVTPAGDQRSSVGALRGLGPLADLGRRLKGSPGVEAVELIAFPVLAADGKE